MSLFLILIKQNKLILPYLSKLLMPNFKAHKLFKIIGWNRQQLILLITYTCVEIIVQNNQEIRCSFQKALEFAFYLSKRVRIWIRNNSRYVLDNFVITKNKIANFTTGCCYNSYKHLIPFINNKYYFKKCNLSIKMQNPGTIFSTEKYGITCTRETHGTPKSNICIYRYIDILSYNKYLFYN